MLPLPLSLSASVRLASSLGRPLLHLGVNIVAMMISSFLDGLQERQMRQQLLFPFQGLTWCLFSVWLLSVVELVLVGSALLLTVFIPASCGPSCQDAVPGLGVTYLVNSSRMAWFPPPARIAVLCGGLIRVSHLSSLFSISYIFGCKEIPLLNGRCYPAAEMILVRPLG